LKGNTTSVLARYDALVLVTHHWEEGHPGVVIEAMAAGIPVLVSRYRAVDELVKSGDNGVILPMRDVDAIATAIAALADRPEERLQMGLAHRARLVDHDAGRAAAMILSLLDPG